MTRVSKDTSAERVKVRRAYGQNESQREKRRWQKDSKGRDQHSRRELQRWRRVGSRQGGDPKEEVEQGKRGRTEWGD